MQIDNPTHIKELIVKWLQYDTKIAEYQKQIKSLNKEKKQLSMSLTEIMKNKNTDIFNVKNVGQIVYTKKEVPKGINKKYLTKILSEYYETKPEVANELYNYIMENRETSIRENIKLKRESEE